MKALYAAVGFMVAVGIALILVACAPGAKAEDRTQQTIDYYQEQVRTLADGRKMTCLVHESGTGYAVTCDWAGAK